MRTCLTKAGKQIPGDEKQLFAEYTLLMQDQTTRDSHLDYEEFQNQHPHVTIAGNNAPITTEQGTFNNFGSQDPWQMNSIPQEHLATFAVTNKNEDRIGVEKVGNVINIAVADGVSTGAVPTLASSAAVLGGLSQMRSHTPDQSTFAAIHNLIQKMHAPSFARNYRKKLSTSTNRNSQNYASRVNELLQNKEVSATTLALAQYDQSASKLRIAIKGDSSVTVIRKDGTYHTYNQGGVNRATYAFNYFVDPDVKYHPDPADVVKEIDLQEGDVVMVYTDGVDKIESTDTNTYKTYQDEIAAKVKELRNAGKGEEIPALIATMMKNKVIAEGVDDDLSFTILRHTPATK